MVTSRRNARTDDAFILVYSLSASMKGSKTDSLWEFASSVISQDYNSVMSMWDRLHATFLAPQNDINSALPQSSILHQMVETIEVSK